MKKLFILATAAFLISGVSFAHEGDKGKGKKTTKTCHGGKECCKKKKAA